MRLILFGTAESRQGGNPPLHQGEVRHSADFHRRHAAACRVKGPERRSASRPRRSWMGGLVSDDIIIGLVKDRLLQDGASRATCSTDSRAPSRRPKR